MAKSPKKPKPEDIETKPDAWERFERMMDKIVPPKPRKKDAGPKPRAPKSGPNKPKD